jgi:hypothetical protein
MDPTFVPAAADKALFDLKNGYNSYDCHVSCDLEPISLISRMDITVMTAMFHVI